MQQGQKIKFLGDIISSSGKMSENIEERINKAIGLRSKLKSIISGISMGICHFEICMILREAVYLNSILVNCESWYFLTKRQIQSLESADTSYLQICFNYKAKTIIDSYYLETGCLKVRHYLAKRRLLFLQSILKRSKSETIFKIYELQKLSGCSYEWLQTVENDETLLWN